MTDEPSVRVTLPEIYKDVQDVKEELVGMNHKLDRFISLNERLDSHKSDINDHEKRVSALERSMAGVKVIVGFVAAGVTAMVVKIFTGG